MAGMDKETQMLKDKKVVVMLCETTDPRNRFLEDLRKDSFEFGPCSQEEGEALIELIHTRYAHNVLGLIKKFSEVGILKPGDELFDWGNYNEHYPGHPYDMVFAELQPACYASLEQLNKAMARE